MNKAFQRVACLAALLLASGAQALTIGEIDVKSALGERFEASIPVTLATGEDLSYGCVRLDDSSGSKYKNVPLLTGYNMRIDRSGKDATIRISTFAGVSEPVFRIGLLIRCGTKVSIAREFLITQSLADTTKK